jgi:FkbM family methyltransferase
LDIGDFIQFEILKSGAYEPEVWAALSRFASGEEIVWDVGANVGSFGVLAACHSSVKEVHCFEPNPRTYKDLERNVRLNPHLKIIPHAVALSDSAQIRPLYLGLEKNTGVSGFHPLWNDASVPVRCVKGDDWIRLGHAPAPSLLKIDVEGAEEDVLRGLAQTLKQKPPKAIVVEGHRDETGRPLSHALRHCLESFGFPSQLLDYADFRQTVNFLATPEQT